MSKAKYTSIGGQALIEGVMMRGPKKTALSVRVPDGSIDTESFDTHMPKEKARILGWPLIRGVAAMIDSMVLGVKCLYRSAEKSGLEDDSDEPQTRFEKWLDRKFGDKIYSIVMGIGTVLGVVLSVGLFILLPMYLVKWLEMGCVAAGWIEPGGLGLWKNLIEGLLKISLFVGYMAAVSGMKEMHRVFEYHGAEHKSIACFEAGVELTPANAKKFRRFHPRCGTSFIVVVLLTSILISCFITWDAVWLRFLCKFLLLPVIVGVGYEFIKITGKYDNWLTRILVAPGLWMQRLTTKEPDESQLEVAITALKAVIPEEEQQAFPVEHATADELTASAPKESEAKEESAC